MLKDGSITIPMKMFFTAMTFPVRDVNFKEAVIASATQLLTH
jgi:hypothetical protein